MNSDHQLHSDLATLTGRADRAVELSGLLPPGRLVETDEDEGRPTLWMTSGPASADLWTAAHKAHGRTGLWPLLLEPLPRDDDFRPWESGELDLETTTSPDLHDHAALLATWWAGHTEVDPDTDPLPETERIAVTAPYGQRWPGLAPGSPFTAEPATFAAEYASHLTDRNPIMRLGMAAAGRGADALAAVGWTGPANHTDDTGEIAAVVRSWEDRFGAMVVGVGFADLYVSVAAPPSTLQEALHVAAEHFAFCPDNIWQNSHPHTLAAYAERLVGLNSWEFWWD
ncbi:DUF4253 domain-containing protein [Nonomuraea spiralis]|uniref:DUF4253 domain-containing protein n=1 Tax=Nonomuraea spiralis TaxID=46182 RepID=A0ABV5IDL3_9ACTN|nr:DUF4253 domain-containing protein [Nonomuraea spiralis]GGS80776.1 hypothetical protein GCM10010176_025400 [Nonomuraea spiralis]